MRRTETPKPIWTQFCVVVDIPDLVTYTNFGDHRLRGFWVAGNQISPSPIDFHRRPYNTLALPCERVMGFTRFNTLIVLFSIVLAGCLYVSKHYGAALRFSEKLTNVAKLTKVDIIRICSVMHIVTFSVINSLRWFGDPRFV